MSDVPTLLPPNASAGEKAFEQATARIGAVPVVQLASLWRPDTCPVALLPWLAWAVGVEVWSSAWDEATKRAAIAAAPYIKRHKGTRGAVNRALTVLGFPFVVTELWTIETRAPHPFRYHLSIDVTGRGASLDDIDQITASVDAAKSLRSLMTRFELTSRIATDTYTAAAAYGGMTVTIFPGL